MIDRETGKPTKGLRQADIVLETDRKTARLTARQTQTERDRWSESYRQTQIETEKRLKVRPD